MWLSKKLSNYRDIEQEGTTADMGVTTIGGANACVMTRGEQRDLEIFSPGGIIWQPAAGDTVLVIKGGVGCQEHCVVAAETASHAPDTMSPGELYLYSSGGGFIYLRADGSIAINGPLKITGRVDIYGSLYVNGIPYRPCACGGA